MLWGGEWVWFLGEDWFMGGCDEAFEDDEFSLGEVWEED